jgi:thiamine-monophosphate kinase
MLISEIGEFGLIDRIKKSVKTDPSVIKGIGDDCAVIEFNKDKYLLFTCDMLIEGIDFTSQDKPYLVGRKALAVSISDIAACAGLPRYALVSLGTPRNISVESVDNIYKGMINLAKEYNINIVGGDISRARQLTLDVSVLGFVEKKFLVLRNGAKKGDIVFVTGELGGSITLRHLTFKPRIKEARFLVENLKINSMIDISDGLAQDLSHILEQSNVGAIIYEGLIPKSKNARNLHDALYRGEDFELIFTMPPDEAKRLIRLKSQMSFKPIGEIVDKKYKLTLFDKSGKEKIIKPVGFRHF